MDLNTISQDNKALNFIATRIKSDQYRGNVSSQHNRYDRREIADILTLLEKYALDGKLLRIRDTDLSRRPENFPEERDYARFCEEVKSKVEKGKGTQDSIRKNIFVDLARMDLIRRYDKNRDPEIVGNRTRIKYVSLTADGTKFVRAANSRNGAFLYAKALDKLLSRFLTHILEILRDPDNKIDSITGLEFMFFVSAIDTNAPFSISSDECVSLIKSWRLLAGAQQRAAVNKLKTKLEPTRYAGDKTAKRDWHNWKNKIDQMMHLMKETPYFVVANNKISLRTDNKNSEGNKVKFKRDMSIKAEYLANHSVQAVRGFDFHHVYPLMDANSAEEFVLFDNWKNIVYIDAGSHALITRNRSQNVVMEQTGKNIVLSDYSGDSVVLTPPGNIRYNAALGSVMVEYNQFLAHT